MPAANGSGTNLLLVAAPRRVRVRLRCSGTRMACSASPSSAPADGAHVRVEIKENALISDSVMEADLPEKGREYHLLPRVDYKYDALNRVRQSHPINITFAVTVDGKESGGAIRHGAGSTRSTTVPTPTRTPMIRRITWTSPGCSRPT